MSPTSLFKSIQTSSNLPLGAKWSGTQISFGIYAENAHCIEYYFYARPHSIKQDHPYNPIECVTLDKDTFCHGQYWFWEAEWSSLTQVGSAIGYLIKVYSYDHPGGQWVLDPYAKNTIGAEEWGHATLFEMDSTSQTLMKRKRTQHCQTHQVRRLPIVCLEQPSEKRPPKPSHPLHESIFYECHVRGMTKHASSKVTPEKESGTYKGLIQKIPYLKELGVTAVELLPIFDFDENERFQSTPEGQTLYNYWGYSPLLFFAPKAGYAANPQNVIQEFQQMVDAFHSAGLEVILDVVYNHTAELDEAGPIDHFKALAKSSYYLHNTGSALLNYSGCGNTLRVAHPVVKQMIIDSLSYWVHEMGVDGFRFDLTPILNRDPDGHLLPFAHFLWELRHHPSFADVKLIAEPWDAAGGHQLGHYAQYAQWAEWNDVYRNVIRQTVRGDQGMLPALKDMLEGSPTVYGSAECGKWFSVNFIAVHDGMTFWDLVSYNHKHNESNGEQNRDGTNDNLSYNCGTEGPTHDDQIQQLRWKKIRLFHFLLQMSQGIPLFQAGDEMGRTQQGNNNFYCWDHEQNWMDWGLLERHLPEVQFVQKLIFLRKQNFHEWFSAETQRSWYNSEGHEEDLRAHIRTTTCLIEHARSQSTFCVFFNFYDTPLPFSFPKEGTWKLLVNTAQLSALEAQIPSDTSFEVEGFSAQLFQLVQC